MRKILIYAIVFTLTMFISGISPIESDDSSEALSGVINISFIHNEIVLDYGRIGTGLGMSNARTQNAALSFDLSITGPIVSINIFEFQLYEYIVFFTQSWYWDCCGNVVFDCRNLSGRLLITTDIIESNEIIKLEFHKNP